MNNNLKSSAGILGEIQIKKINLTGEFWDETYKSTLMMTVELGYKTEVIRTHGISDIIIVSQEGSNDKVLIKWYKRLTPLTDERLLEKYGRVKEED